MRADRLLSLLMLLQTRGRMTARELAEELEVTERTIYRDVLVLSSSGVPVYTERGPGGGIELLEDYHTNLTGLTVDETRALFMLSIPEPLVKLGVGSELRAALLKLTAALPGRGRSEEERSRQRIYLDSVPWHQPDLPLPFLSTIQQAVWQDEYLVLKYRSEFNVEIDVLLEPYGLVAKANLWHLVGRRESGLRVIPIGQVLEARLTGEKFERPEDFKLGEFWKAWCARIEAGHLTFTATLRVSPELLAQLPRERKDLLQAQLADPAVFDEQGWAKVSMPFSSFFEARNMLLSYGRAAEVLEPEQLRLSVLDFALQIVSFYSTNCA
jgi:predicted DNA-binding transcriptional regulator YafY